MDDHQSEVLSRLVAIIRGRRAAPADGSYTRQLLDAGAGRCAKKLGEEAVETIIAALGESREALTAEAADLIYHLLVLLEVRDVAFEQVLAELGRRIGKSGLAEKAERARTGP
jgi:phosphoribosyl-ATP pyrophosphohydrolase